MRRMSFSNLLSILLFAPLTAVVLFAGTLSYQSWSHYNDLKRAESILHVALAAARFIGIGIPPEGAATREFLASSGNKPALDAARRHLDDYYQQIREAMAALSVKDASLDEQMRGLDERMRLLNAARQKIDTNTFSGDITSVLAPAAGRAIDLVAAAAATTGDPVLSRRIFGVFAMLQLNDSTLLERGIGATYLQRGQLATEPYLLLAKHINWLPVFRKLFADYAPAEAVEIYRSFQATDGGALDDLRGVILKNAG